MLFNKPLRLLRIRTFSTDSRELAIIGEYQLPEGCRYSVSRSGCEVQSHHRGLMKTSNFRREIRKTYYRNDPVKYDLRLQLIFWIDFPRQRGQFLWFVFILETFGRVERQSLHILLAERSSQMPEPIIELQPFLTQI